MLIPLTTLSAYAVPLPGTITAEVDGVPHDIDYEVDGVEVLSVEANMDDMSLIFEVQVTDPGLLRLDFERSFFDATFEGSDDEFFVIADGDFADLEETQTTSTLRSLLIQLESGTEEIEIFGTHLAGSTFGEPEVEEPPVIEEPPVVEEPPVIEEPPVVEEPPEVEEPPPVMEEKPKTECGPGTVLKDGVCVLDKTCGPGTHLEDGVCVLDKTPSEWFNC